MRTLKFWILAIVAAAIAGCSGSDNTLVVPPNTGGGSGGGSGGGGTGTPAAATITVTSSSPTIPSDGSAGAMITAFVSDANNTLISGVPVSFTASSGGISGGSGVTSGDGTATANLVTAGDDTLRTIMVTATAGTLQATVNVQVVASSSSTTVQMGNGTGASFQPGIISISNAMLSAGGSTSLTVSLVQSDDTLYTGSATISFNSPCVAASTAQIRQNGSPVNNVTTTTGIATVTYVAQGCSGGDVITATSSLQGQSLSASGSVTVAAATVGSIEFVSATPTNIALKNTGDAGRPETSTVVFRVKDSSNGAVSGANVNFSLNTSVGGIALTTSQATSDNQGLVQTIVNAGTVATSVKVTATVAATQISTQSSQLTVTTGIPTAASFSLALECFNIEGWQIDGTTTAVTARLGDRFQNPVPDGTAVTFTAEGGNIQSQCTTISNATEGGLCSVNFRSSEPRPSDGRITILAKAIGEETFVDANGNGAFDAQDPTFSDLPEPFRDDSEDGLYQAGEDFFDFNNNQMRDVLSGGVYVGDGLFNGVLCNDPARCGDPTVDPTTQSTGIGRQGLVILSGSSAVITQPGGAALPPMMNMPTNSAQSLSFWVRDVNGNIMPGGTSVTLQASGAGLQVSQPNSFDVLCSTIDANTEFPGLTVFTFNITSGSTTGTGVVTLTVETPSGVQTLAQITVSVP
jgi:Bacterial Ig-like domain (group 1)